MILYLIWRMKKKYIKDVKNMLVPVPVTDIGIMWSQDYRRPGGGGASTILGEVIVFF